MLYLIYCGRSIPATTKTVSETEINQFFKDQSYLSYWTYISCKGGWVDHKTKETILEDSFIVEFYTSDLEKDAPNVFEFAKMYKARFSQDSVLVVENHKTQYWI
jgi:Protein of unknown function (DUF3574)